MVYSATLQGIPEAIDDQSIELPVLLPTLPELPVRRRTISFKTRKHFFCDLNKWYLNENDGVDVWDPSNRTSERVPGTGNYAGNTSWGGGKDTLGSGDASESESPIGEREGKQWGSRTKGVLARGSPETISDDDEHKEDCSSGTPRPDAPAQLDDITEPPPHTIHPALSGTPKQTASVCYPAVQESAEEQRPTIIPPGFDNTRGGIGSAEPESTLGGSTCTAPLHKNILGADELRNSSHTTVEPESTLSLKLLNTSGTPKQKPKAKQLFSKFISAVKRKVSIKSRNNVTGMNVEVTDIYVVDESSFADWIVIDAQSYSGIVSSQSELSMEPADEVRMTFISEDDFLDWVNIQEFSESVAIRCFVEPQYQQIFICTDYAPFETASESSQSCNLNSDSGCSKIPAFANIPQVPINEFRKIGFVDVDDLMKTKSINRGGVHGKNKRVIIFVVSTVVLIIAVLVF